MFGISSTVLIITAAMIAATLLLFSFIAQMFLVPGLIVAGAVVLLLGFSWLAGGIKSRDRLLEDLASHNPDIRWRTANDLAQVLKRDPELATDAQFGLELAGQLRETMTNFDRDEASAAARVPEMVSVWSVVTKSMLELPVSVVIPVNTGTDGVSATFETNAS